MSAPPVSAPAASVPVALTEHARRRMQQRGISIATLRLLLRYGRRLHDHHGGTVLCLDKAGRRRLGRHPERRWLEKSFNAYAVLADDGSVLTVGHRTRRLPRS